MKIWGSIARDGLRFFSLSYSPDKTIDIFFFVTMFFLQGEPLGKLVSLASQPEHESFVLDARHDSIVVSLCELSILLCCDAKCNF